MRFNSNECLVEVDKDGNMGDGVGIEVMELETIEI
jgi:hypothetical protein